MAEPDCINGVSDETMEWLYLMGLDWAECWGILRLLQVARVHCRPGILWTSDQFVARALQRRFSPTVRLLDRLLDNEVVRARRDGKGRRVYEFSPRILPAYEGDPRDLSGWDIDWEEEIARSSDVLLSFDSDTEEQSTGWRASSGIERSAMRRWRARFLKVFCRESAGEEQAQALARLRGWIAEGLSGNVSRPAHGFVDAWFKAHTDTGQNDTDIYPESVRNDTDRPKRHEENDTKLNDRVVSFGSRDSDDGVDDGDSESKHHHQHKDTQGNDTAKTTRNSENDTKVEVKNGEVIRLLRAQGVWRAAAHKIAAHLSPEVVLEFVKARSHFTFEAGHWPAYLVAVLTQAAEQDDPLASLPEAYLEKREVAAARERKQQRDKEAEAAGMVEQLARDAHRERFDSYFAALSPEEQHEVEADALDFWKTLTNEGDFMVDRYRKQREQGEIKAQVLDAFRPYRDAVLSLRMNPHQASEKPDVGARIDLVRRTASDRERQAVRDAVRVELQALFPDLSERIGNKADAEVQAAYERLTKNEWLRRSEVPEEAT